MMGRQFFSTEYKLCMRALVRARLSIVSHCRCQSRFNPHGHAYDLDPRLLIEDTNTIAVEIHQCSVTSANVSFDLQLLVSDRNTADEPFNYTPGTPVVSLTNVTGQWWTAAGSGATQASVAAGSLNV